jgi:hypothetical protein
MSMRLIALLPLLAIAACSGSSEPAKQEGEAEAAPAATIAAGQWETSTEVTSLVQRDKGAPAIKMEKGSKTSRSVCVAEADGKQPPPALLVPEGLDCKYRDAYVSGGRLNATLACTRPGLSGDISTIVNGSFTATTLEGTATIETRLSGEGDARIDTRLTGRRTGDCTAPATTKG